jgi:hypothetical protein
MRVETLSRSAKALLPRINAAAPTSNLETSRCATPVTSDSYVQKEDPVAYLNWDNPARPRWLSSWSGKMRPANLPADYNGSPYPDCNPCRPKLIRSCMERTR